MSLIWVICHCNHQTMNMLKMCATPEQRYNYEMFKIIKIRFILLLTLRNIVIIWIFKKRSIIILYCCKVFQACIIASHTEMGQIWETPMYIYLFTLFCILNSSVGACS